MHRDGYAKGIEARSEVGDRCWYSHLHGSRHRTPFLVVEPHGKWNSADSISNRSRKVEFIEDRLDLRSNELGLGRPCDRPVWVLQTMPRQHTDHGRRGGYLSRSAQLSQAGDAGCRRQLDEYPLLGERPVSLEDLFVPHGL